jgi:DEAD/DEAH box helicase domain-containing protein
LDRESQIGEFVKSLLASERLGSQVVFQKTLPATPGIWANPEKPWPEAIRAVLKSAGIVGLYRHQAQAIDHIRSGRHVVVATPTASGKTLIYDLPALELFLTDPDATALFIFPLKALAQNQLQTFKTLAAHLSPDRPTAAIYDGDTSGYRRKRIREAPPNVVITNPEMLHLSLLAHHRKWSHFLSRLGMVVIDEVHTYRGIFGSHVAQILRRLRRICSHYSISPTFVFSSATVANPAQLVRQLSGLSAETIDQSGAPRGRRQLIFLNPAPGPARSVILLLKAALARGLRTIVYTQSRKLTELISMWAAAGSGALGEKISAYRAGLLPHERREIEARLASGDLLAVVTTSALELGIDIGDLDLCLLAGYPGSIISTWQRGGRVGRSGQESALILIAGQDALDQYFMRNPQDFIDRQPEAAVINPFNLQILTPHLECAAAELPLRADEVLLKEENGQRALAQLENEGRLLKSGEGDEYFARRKIPHGDIDLRGAGRRFQITEQPSGNLIGEIDDYRAFRETHPGAVYLHKGDSFVVEKLDAGRGRISVSRARINYYTRVRGYKLTEILEIYREISVSGTKAYNGKIKVTDQVTEYERWDAGTKQLKDRIALALPAQVFETEGFWFQIPESIRHECESGRYDLMGALHAIEHAAIGIFPLLVMADHNDIGGLSTNYHPQVGKAVIFIYDGIPGGAGLTRQAFTDMQRLLECTLKAISSCPCESGCPSCVQSPQCGSGNRPMDKNGAIFILDRLQTRAAPGWVHEPGVEPSGFGRPASVKRSASRDTRLDPEIETAGDLRFGVLDLETQRSAAEVGGWHRADRMGISCGVLYDSQKNTFSEYFENQIEQLIADLQRVDLIVGFNIKRFDYLVLKGYSDFDFLKLNTLDILETVRNYLGFRLSLAHLAQATLGTAKLADGLQALQWWKQGRIAEIVAYCKMDVKLTRDLFNFGKQHGYLVFINRDRKTARIPVQWRTDQL